MAKLKCACGHIIVDQTDNISSKAMFIRDQDDDKTDCSEDIDSFIKAIQSGHRNSWIEEFFTPEYPKDLENSYVINDIISRYERDLKGTLYQCERCGRIKIQIDNKNFFASFKPEDEQYREIFKGLSSR